MREVIENLHWQGVSEMGVSTWRDVGHLALSVAIEFQEIPTDTARQKKLPFAYKILADLLEDYAKQLREEAAECEK